ncbi:MAG: DUF711 family protein [bacterium]
MKVRTITAFSNLSYPANPEELEKIAVFNRKAKRILEERGFEVQETRIATNFFEGARLNLSYEDVLAWVVNVQSICDSCGIDFLSLGTIKPGVKASAYKLIPEIISQTETVSLSTSITLPDRSAATLAVRETAEAIRLISAGTDRGTGNFRFGAIANCPALVPFFPSGYHDSGPLHFSVGFETGNKLFEIAHEAPNEDAAMVVLLEELKSQCGRIEEVCGELSKQEGIDYAGADISLTPGLLETESVCLSVEKLAGGSLGCPGTLKVVAMLVETLRKVEVKKCGYSGIFLPVLEDHGLAERANEGTLTLPLLLAISAVCGAGLDAVPLPGDVSESRLGAILFDVAGLSGRTGKPLSARLLPAPGKTGGEKTEFGLPFFIDCATIPA